MAWFAASGTIVLAAMIILIPGLAVALVAGARGLRAWALAAPITLAITGATALALPFLGVRFGLLSAAAAFVVVFVGTWLVRRLWGARWPDVSFGMSSEPTAPTAPRWIVGGALMLGMGTTAFRLVRGIGDPQAIAQLFDNIFHLNAIATIAMTGNGSSLTLGNLTAASSTGYPAGFHDLSALVYLAVGGSVPLTLNAVTIVLGAVVWPLSVVFLATRLWGKSPAVYLGAALVIPALAAFPYRMLSFGVLYSFFCALTLLPVLWAVLLELFGTTRTRAVPVLSAAITVATVGLAVGLCHPSVVVAALVFAAPFAVARAFTAIGPRRAQSAVPSWVIIMLVLIYLVVTAGIFVVLRPDLDTAPWNPNQTLTRAVLGVATVRPMWTTLSWVLVLLLLAGIIAVLASFRRSWPILATWGLGGLLYVAAVGFPVGSLRDLLAGVWYRDGERLGALMSIAAVPLLIGGFVAIAHVLGVIAARVSANSTAPALALTSIACVALIALVQLQGPREASGWIAQSFGQTGAQGLLTDDERSLLNELDTLVPVDDVVVGNPMTGASLTPAFSERRALAPHVFGTRSADELLLLGHWDEAGTRPDVCDAIRRTGAYWALDFGTQDVLGRGGDILAGTDTLTPATPGITERARHGDAVLFEATACL